MINRSDSTGTFHRVVSHGDQIWLSGVTAGNPSLDMAGQTSAALERIDALLTANGSDRNHLLHATIYITDFALKDDMNKAWLEFFAADVLPARATLGVADLGEGVLIEIVATALKKG